MKTFEFRREQWVPRPIDEVFAFFSDPTNLERITPPWLSFRILSSPSQPIQPGALITYRLRLHGLPIRWVTEITEWSPPTRFVDVQLSGPYALWHHTHEFESRDSGTLLRDTVRYGLPLGPIGGLVSRLFVRRDVEKIFDYRAETIRSLFGHQPGSTAPVPAGPLH